MEKRKAKTIGFIVLILFLLSLFLFILKQGIFFFVPRTNFSDRMASMAAMMILTGILVGKVITGLCFGIVLGAVRFKTRNCYSTILLYGGMNLFGR